MFLISLLVLFLELACIRWFPSHVLFLVIGAGSGNDVSRALAWGATRVDAVEIDPAIYRLGAQHHPDRPYDDPRVFVDLNDGRNFLKSSNKQ